MGGERRVAIDEDVVAVGLAGDQQAERKAARQNTKARYFIIFTPARPRDVSLAARATMAQSKVRICVW